MDDACMVKHAEVKSIPFNFCETVVGVFTRYPNPLAKHVQSSDTIVPFTINESGELVGKSITMKTNPLPKIMMPWKNRVGLYRQGIQVIALVEEYQVNLQKATLRHLTRNITSREYLKTHEFVEYSSTTKSLNTPQIVSPEHAIKPSLATNDNPRYGVMIDKQFACSTSIRYGLSLPIRAATSGVWLKNSYKQTHGLCYAIANNQYCPALANEFLAVGKNQEKWQRAVENLREIRQRASQRILETRSNLTERAQLVGEKVHLEIQNPRNIQRLHEVVKKVPKP